MATTLSPTPSGLMSREQAAQYLGLKVQTLAAWATGNRYGLPYIRVGRRIMYRQTDLDGFLARRTVNATPAQE